MLHGLLGLLAPGFLQVSSGGNFPDTGGYSQCGIQFRLESYIAVPVPQELYIGDAVRIDSGASCLVELPADRPNASGPNCIVSGQTYANTFGLESFVCGEGVPATADMRRDAITGIIEMAKSIPRYNYLTDLVDVGTPPGMDLVLTGGIAEGLLGQNCPGTDYGLSDGAFWAAVSDAQAWDEPTTLSHEMGHVLLGSRAHYEFQNGAIDLMKEGVGDGYHIHGCQTWQKSFPGAPVGCDLTAGFEPSTFNLCDEMRGTSQPAPAPAEAPFEMDPLDATDFGMRWSYGRFSWGQPTSEVEWSEADQTAGTASIIVPTGFTSISSPGFRPADLEEVGDTLSLDVYIPTTVPNPWWVGSVALSVDVPSLGIYNLWITQAELTALPRGAWSTVSFSLPPQVTAALQSDVPVVQFFLDTNSDSAGLLLDNLRFDGTLVDQTVEHHEGSSASEVALLPHGGFEAPGTWTATSGTVSLETTMVLEGGTALSLAAGYTAVESIAFATSELVGQTDTLTVDVFVPNPQPNPWWVGDIQLFASCPSAGLNNQWIGQQSLTNLFGDEFNQVLFSVPSALQAAWNGDHQDCTLTAVVNSNAGSASFIIDRLGFYE